MSETKIVWHKYSSERPPKTGHFLITSYKYVDGRNLPAGDVQIRTDLFDREVECFMSEVYDGLFVIAWAELPEPYQPDGDEK